ncbi:MAG: hypothetical protein K5795_03965 [Lachnospiraceae bacterium]|jgi:hypothetical protein|nr:hypothetical protein [Lachnospiraceae bacterium]
MDKILIIAIVACILLFVLKFFYRSHLYDKCTGTTIGHYLYSEWKGKLNGRMVESCWDPVCEYCVDDTVYIVELEIMAPSNKFDIDEIEVKYLPSNPEVCFISNTRGKLLSTHKNAE